MSTDTRRLFLELARQGSFAATARKLDLARSTVMRRIEDLEAELGVRLVHRAGRTLALTAAGHRLADGLRAAFRAMERVEQDVKSSAGQAAGAVRLCLPLLGTSPGIVASLAAFVQAYPQIVLRVDVGRDARASQIGDFDVMLQMSHRANPDLHVMTLFRDRLILVASQAYLDARGEPRAIDELAEHTAIEQRDLSGRVVPWRLASGARLGMPPPCVSTHGNGYVYEFALLGMGIGRVSQSLALPALRDGRLKQVLPEVVVEEPLNMVFLPDPSRTTRAFLDFMGQFWADWMK